MSGKLPLWQVSRIERPTNKYLEDEKEIEKRLVTSLEPQS